MIPYLLLLLLPLRLLKPLPLIGTLLSPPLMPIPLFPILILLRSDPLTLLFLYYIYTYIHCIVLCSLIILSSSNWSCAYITAKWIKLYAFCKQLFTLSVYFDLAIQVLDQNWTRPLILCRLENKNHFLWSNLHIFLLLLTWKLLYLMLWASNSYTFIFWKKIESFSFF